MKTLLLSLAALTVAGGLGWLTLGSGFPGRDRLTVPQEMPADLSTAAQPDEEPTAQPDESTAIPQATHPSVGQFRTVDPSHPTAGTVRLVTENGQHYLDFDDTFATARGPDVQVVLYPQSVVPGTLANVSYLTLAPLQRFRGAQRYAIPATVNLADYQSVGIWCRRFDITFGYAAF